MWRNVLCIVFYAAGIVSGWPRLHTWAPTARAQRSDKHIVTAAAQVEFPISKDHSGLPLNGRGNMYLTLLIGIAVIVSLTLAMTEFRDMIRVTLFGSRNSSGADFEPARDIPSLAGKIVLITGAAGDLGRQTAIELARYGRPARIYIADLPRDSEAKNALARRILQEAYKDSDYDKKADATEAPRTEIRFLELDLSSFDSVRKCAADFLAQEQRLDILFLNAGIIRVAAETTTEGYEIHFGINYLGHALLSRLLLPFMQRTVEEQLHADVRVVIVSSEGHLAAPKGGIDFDKLKTDCSHLASISSLSL